MNTRPPAGWYPDFEDATRMRYWDGTQWTHHLSSRPLATGATPVPAGSPGTAAEGHRIAYQDTAEAKIPLFGARRHARATADELRRSRAAMERLGVLEVADLEERRESLAAELATMRSELTQQKESLERQIAELKQRVVTTEEAEILQEVGIYEYRHPLSDSVAYKAELARLKDRIKATVRADAAILAAQGWSVNGSAAQGRKMIRDYSKLMLRAYNAEADNLVRGLKPYKLDSAIDRLNKVTATIERLGKTMSIRVAPEYHQLRVKELKLTADYQEKLAREKEQAREEKERLREQRKLEQEIARERARLDKERQHYSNALEALLAKGDIVAADRLRAQLEDIERALEEVDYREANVRAGYVYVIFNVGALGEQMIKVGMTRRLEPMDRIRELSDASVPFNFDVHALFFSDDAYGIEAQMHQRLASKRVNRVNLRREFFHATPLEARDLLQELTGDLLQFDEQPEALEYHQSLRVSENSEAG